MNEVKCFDCGKPYGDDDWTDMVIQNNLWRLISPTKDLGGILCANCICNRLSKLGLASVVCTVDLTHLIKN